MTLKVFFIQFEEIYCEVLCVRCINLFLLGGGDVEILILGTLFVLCYTTVLLKQLKISCLRTLSVSVWDIIYLGPSLPLQKWSDLIR